MASWYIGHGCELFRANSWYRENCLEVFEKDIHAAKPLLKTLAQYSRIVWLSQVPVIPSIFKQLADIYNEKLLPMNRLARRVLQ